MNWHHNRPQTWHLGCAKVPQLTNSNSSDVISSAPGAIINFCSNDYPFLRQCIDAIKPVSSQIIIPVCDHFFDGKKEDRDTLEKIYAEHLDVQFIEFAFDQNKRFYGAYPPTYWHSLARMVGSFFLKKEISYVLFLDCDEIADTVQFSQWLNTFNYRDYEAIRFYNYWYFRESHFQATTWENSPLLIKKQLLNGTLLMTSRERPGMYDEVTGNKIKRVSGNQGKPMFHHYSWVRTREQLLRKVNSWGHQGERNWHQLIEEEFSRDFNGTDFVHGYQFIKVSPDFIIDVLEKPKEFSRCDFSHVYKLSLEDIFKIDISLTYQIPLSLASLKVR